MEDYRVNEFMENYEIKDTFCLWEDLLGFGQPLYANHWNLENGSIKKNITRLKMLEHELLNVTDPFCEKVFSLNDGFVRTYEPEPNHIFSLLRWFDMTVKNFIYLNARDIKNGFPGVRGVLSSGQRLVYSDRIRVGLGDFIQTTPQKRADYNANKTAVNAPRELQMNTAFSKAYIIESSGKRFGVEGNNLFIDIEVLEKMANSINTIGKEQLGQTIDDFEKNGIKLFYYRAEVSEKSFDVYTTRRNKTWLCFQLQFEGPCLNYDNPNKSICTKLLIPTKMVSDYYCDDGLDSEVIDLRKLFKDSVAHSSPPPTTKS